jgi:hypothetical protein
MARKKRWETSDIANGIGEFKLFSWRYFPDFVYQEMLDFRHYIWRGQRCDNWRLEPTLDRKIKHLSVTRQRRLRQQHLINFQYAVRVDVVNSGTSQQNDWWALGQHHGLHTPCWIDDVAVCGRLFRLPLEEVKRSAALSRGQLWSNRAKSADIARPHRRRPTPVWN